MTYEAFKTRVMEYAKECGMDEYELYYTEVEDMEADAMMHTLNGFSTTTKGGACFRCVYGGKMGYAATEMLDEEEALRIVDAAKENAKMLENEDLVWIHEPGDQYADIAPIRTTEPTAAQLIEAVLALEEKIFAKDERVKVGSQTFAGFGRMKVALSNSKGLDLEYDSDYSQVGALALLQDGSEMYNGISIKTDDFTKIDLDEIADEAVEEAISTIGNESVASGVYDVVLSGKVMSTFLATYMGVFSAQQAQSGLSLFAGKEGGMVASPLVNITDDPFCEDTFARMPFDGEGVATYRKSLVENGKLVTLLHNLTTAHKAGCTSTGNGRKASYESTVSVSPYNMYMEKGGAGTKEDIFKTVGSGIYVTGLNGIHAGANPVTGDFSLAAEGFWIENGAKDHVIKNFTVSGNYYELLKKIVLVGDDLKFPSPAGGSCFGAPTVVVKEISVAGK
jgi:PmbA protein